MVGAAGCALVFRVNLPLALLVTLYTNPLTIVPLYVLAYQIGRLIIGDHSSFVAPPAFDPTIFVAWTSAMQGWMMNAAKPLGIGLVVLASLLSVLGYAVTKAAWRVFLMRAWRRRKLRS